MLKTVSQSFAPVTVDKEASLGLLMEELLGLLRSGLRLTVCVRAVSAVDGAGGSATVRCQDCGVPGHYTKRYGGCAMFEMPRGDHPRQPDHQRRQRTYAEVASSPFMSPPSSHSPSSGEVIEDLLRVPHPPKSHPKPRKGLTRSRLTATPPSPTMSPPKTSPPQEPPSGSPPAAAATLPPPSAVTPVLDARPGVPALTIQPSTTPADSEDEEDVMNSPPMTEERMARCRVLRQQCRRYFTDDQLHGALTKEWEALLLRDLANANKRDFLDIAEFFHILPSEPWPDGYADIALKIEFLAQDNKTLYYEVQRRCREILGHSPLARRVDTPS